MLKYINVIVLIIILSIIICSCDNSIIDNPDQSTYLGQVVPEGKATRFASEIITNNFFPHSKMIISPTGNRIYWSTYLDLVSTNLALYYSDFDGEKLSPAEMETVLAQYGVLNFTFMENEDKIIFGSCLPNDEMGGELVYAVWTSEKADNVWGKPEPIEGTVDINWESIGSVSINISGDIYFSGSMKGKSTKIYCAKFENGIYKKFEPLPEIINTGIANDPFIDYHDKYLLFASAGRSADIGIIDLYISYKDQYGNWGQPSNLGQGISTRYIDRFPMITRDGKYLFFVTSHSDHFPSTYTHFYWVDAQFIEDYLP